MLDRDGDCGYDLEAGGHGHAVHSADSAGRRGEKPLNAAFFCGLLTRQPRLKRLVIFSKRARVIEEVAIDADCVVSHRFADAH